jgi:16S rRNA (uracil1498-N3)-methyltransferase
MRVNRIHVPGPLAAGEEVMLPRQAGEHLTRVLRMEPGATFTVFDGRGGEYAAQLATTGRQVSARLLRHDALERESPLILTLLQGVARGERMDLIVQKATELGVTRIVPVLTERSVVKVDVRQRTRKHEHWQAIAISACEQCGRNRIPEVAEPQGLGDALAALPADTNRCLLAADGALPLASVPRGGSGIALLIGPEGGLADGERRLARAQNFVAYRLGPRILRTETAGLAALATLQATLGDLSA